MNLFSEVECLIVLPDHVYYRCHRPARLDPHIDRYIWPILGGYLTDTVFAKYKEGAKVHRHSKDRETPFAVYIDLTVFAKTKKRQLIE